MKKHNFAVNNEEVIEALRTMKVGQVAVVVRSYYDNEKYRFITKVSPVLFKSEYTPFNRFGSPYTYPSCFTAIDGLCFVQDFLAYDKRHGIKTQLLGVL